jgi:23S rRNA (uracil1939-C5)-methyltransferase
MAFPLAPDISLRIEGLHSDGRGIARLDGLAVFVEDVVPGEVVRARLTRVTRTHADAEVLRIEAASLDRVVPRCPHVGTCGGCVWQHLAYPAQASAKEAIVVESLQRVTGLRHPPVRPIIAMDDPWAFRNKMEFSFQPPDRLGLHRRARWDEVVDLQTCFLPSSRVLTVLRAVRAFMRAQRIPCYDTRTHQGFLRHLVVRESRATGELLVAVVTAPGPFPHADALTETLRQRVPHLAGLVWAINASVSDAVQVSRLEVLHGRPFIREHLGTLSFKLDLSTFFQTNTVQAERMTEVVREFAALGGTERVVDLYCGVGPFALTLAGAAAHVVGIEAVVAAVDAARDNARLNGIANAVFHTADAADVEGVLAGGGQIDVLVLDPPRAGAGATVMRRIGQLAPRRVIYVSCNPATLAADLLELLPRGYEVTAIQPIDFFPHTYHVECVVQLKRAATQ